jgi:long-chain acyl-CoA synthetase
MGQLIAGQSPVFETVNTAFDDTAVIFYTSGTTGNPKGAELSHANLAFNSLGIRDLAQGVDEDVMLIALSLFHAFGQICQMTAGITGGATLVLMPRFEPKEVLSAMPPGPGTPVV